MIPSSDFRQQLLQELIGNILPFWMTHLPDKQRGGFYGALTNDLRPLNHVPRSAVLCARLLWTYAAAFRRLKDERYLPTARRAYDYLTGVFWDDRYEGVYWQVDADGRPIQDRKHHYAQAFAIYALAEYYRATDDTRSLLFAQTLFERLEKHGYDRLYGGYLEGSNRAWDPLTDMRLSEKDLNCRKSMNTNLHVLEAYTNLRRVWNDERLKNRHRALLETFLQHILDRQSGHLRLFFDDRWTSAVEIISYGHDIECSWLLWEAACLQDDRSLQERTRQASLALAEAVYRDGLEPNGSVRQEGGANGHANAQKEWWAHAEAVVGFYNAYQLSGEERYAQAAWQVWQYICQHFVDRVHGDWFKRLEQNGAPDPASYKAGPWECPYHQSRMCFEMLERLPS